MCSRRHVTFKPPLQSSKNYVSRVFSCYSIKISPTLLKNSFDALFNVNQFYRCANESETEARLLQCYRNGCSKDRLIEFFEGFPSAKIDDPSPKCDSLCHSGTVCLLAQMPDLDQSSSTYSTDEVFERQPTGGKFSFESFELQSRS